MTSQFSPKVSQILAFSREEATRLYSSSVGPEHILLGMMREENNLIQHILMDMDINPTNIKNELENRINEYHHLQSETTKELTLDEKASNILKLAVLEARLQRAEVVDVQHLLLAILHDQVNNGAKDILEKNHMTYENTLKYLQMQTNPIKNGIELPEEEGDFMESPNGQSGQHHNGHETITQTTRNSGKTPILDNFSTDLTQAALEGKLDPVVGREKEIQRVTEILCRRKKNNPILIGEPGVGKSAIVEGLAQSIAKRHTSPILFNKRVVNLDMTAIVAGTKYRGQFEERIRALIKELEQNNDIIVFIDEIHTLVGAGSTPGSMDAANIMKPALARGVIQCIGATTLNEYRNSIEKDGALERRFQKILVEPTTTDETLEILQNIKERYERHHHVFYTEDALKACVRLTERYVTDRFFPDKAIDALDEVGAKVHLQHAEVPPAIIGKEKEIGFIKQKKLDAVKNQNFELAASYRDRQSELEQELEQLNNTWTNSENGERETIEGKDVANVVSLMTGIPVQRMAEAEGVRLKNMANELKKVVIAQDAAIEKMTKAIQRNRLGLKDPNRPIGAFMFLGPTGVGKTHLAKRLAQHMFGTTDALIRIDMSEYTESFNASRLVGAPPGYVGYEEGGQLTEKVRRHPYSIILLDEIEKAHSSIFNLLLQVLDEGRLTDGNGRLVDFRNTVIIMTSNTGTRQLKDFGRGIGFSTANSGDIIDQQHRQYARQIIQRSLRNQFAPEFLNRLDEIITFEQLDIDAIKKIVDIELEQLSTRIKTIGYHLQVEEQAKLFVATKGYDPQYGARPLRRAIQSYIEDSVCEILLEGELDEGKTILVDKHPEKEELTVTLTTQPNS